jgi:hypothetical protein
MTMYTVWYFMTSIHETLPRRTKLPVTVCDSRGRCVWELFSLLYTCRCHANGIILCPPSRTNETLCHSDQSISFSFFGCFYNNTRLVFFLLQRNVPSLKRSYANTQTPPFLTTHLSLTTQQRLRPSLPRSMAQPSRVRVGSLSASSPTQHAGLYRAAQPTPAITPRYSLLYLTYGSKERLAPNH